MNAIILSAIWGVVMMFSSVSFKDTAAVRTIAITGLLLLLVVNIAELYGFHLFHINTRGMLSFNSFTLVFNSLAFGSTLVFFLLSSRDMDKVSLNTGEYFALIFFVLCGISIASSFDTL